MTEAQRAKLEQIAGSPETMDALRVMALEEANSRLPQLRGAASQGNTLEALRHETYINTVEGLPDLIERMSKRKVNG